MSAVLREHELLVPGSLEWDWFVYGSGGTGLITRMSLKGADRRRSERRLTTTLPPPRPLKAGTLGH